MPEDLRVTLATISRFNIFELAAQLEKHGVLDAIYTGFARHFVGSYPIASGRIRTFPWFQTPLEAAQRLHLIPRRWEESAGWCAKQALDRHIARTMTSTHIYCAMSGIGLESGAAAQSNGAVFVCNRLSCHIMYQDKILRQEFDRLDIPFAGIDQQIVDKECAEYDAADAILVPSAFARRSFLAAGLPQRKVHTIPFGVNTSTFRKTLPRDENFRILFVGQLSVRKGLHELLKAFRTANLRNATLVLVGAAQPETKLLLERFPVDSVEITGPLGQRDIADQMSRASVFVLPSIEDGFGLVMAEAMACGCPVIASENTGASDLFSDGDEGVIVPVSDAEALAENFSRLYREPQRREEMARNAARRVAKIGGWDSYGNAVVRLFEDLARAAGHNVTARSRQENNSGPV